MSEKFEAESKQYNQIILNYIENDQVFVDPNFHPHQHIQEKNLLFVESDTEWKRIDEVYQAPLFKKELIGINYIKQGDLSDCFFLSALSYLSTQPEKVPFLFDHRVEHYMNKEEDTINLKCGAVVVYLYAFGRRVPVLIDTLIPFSKTTQKAIFSQPISDSKSPWFCLVEKAYAKLNGSYSEIASGTFSEAIYSLYGFYSTNKHLSSLKSEVKNSLMSPFDRIQKYLNQRAIIGAKIHIELLDGLTEKDIDQKGLVTNQSYLLLSAKKVSGINLICLRNSWVANRWNGDWSDGSEMWNPEMKRAVEFENSEDGTFWMSDTDFLNYFTEIDVLKPIPNKWYLRQFLYQLLPSFNDGFDIESEEASLNERPNFAFQIIDSFEKGENCRFHIFVERRQSATDDRLNEEKTPFCVFIVSNSGKKIVASELPFCRKYQMTSSSNLISFPYTVSSNEEILTIVLYRLNKCELVEDCYVKIFCERDFKLYNIDEPEKVISEDKITFSSKLLSELDKISIFDQDDANVEEEEEDLDKNESNKEEENKEINQNDEFSMLQSKNYFNEIFRNLNNQVEQNDQIEQNGQIKQNNQIEQNDQINQNDQIKQNDEFSMLQNKNYFNEIFRNINDQVKQNDQIEQNGQIEQNNQIEQNDEFNILQSKNYFSGVEIDQNIHGDQFLFRNESNETEGNQNNSINNEINERTNNVSFYTANNNEFNRNETDNKIDDQHSSISNKNEIANAKSIILNENQINSNDPLQNKPNAAIYSKDEKVPKINSTQPQRMLEKKTSGSVQLNFNATLNNERISQINSIQQNFRPNSSIQSNDQTNTEINSMQLPKKPDKNAPNIIESISSNQPNVESISKINSMQPLFDQNSNIQSDSEKISQINSMQQNFRPNSSIQSNDQTNTEINSMQLPKKPDKKAPNIIESISSNQSESEKISQINSMQQNFRPNSSIQSNDQTNTEINSIQFPKKPDKKAPNTANQKSNEERTTQINSMRSYKKSVKESPNHSNAGIQLDAELKPLSSGRQSKRSVNHKSSQNRKISKEMMQPPSKSFKQRKLAHQKMNETFMSQMTRKQSPNREKQQSVIRSQKSDTTLKEEIILKKRKISPIRSPGEMRSEKMTDLNQTGQHSPNSSGKKSKQPNSQKAAFSNKDMHKMFSSITDNVFISHFTDNK